MSGKSPFTESIIIATICGRAQSHRRQSIVEPVYGLLPEVFWDHHDLLYTMLKTHYDSLVKQYSTVMQQTDCMLLFTNMMVQTTVLYLDKVIESMTWETANYRALMLDFKQKTLIAAKEMVNLTKWLPNISYFKVYNQSHSSKKNLLPPLLSLSLSPPPFFLFLSLSITLSSSSASSLSPLLNFPPNIYAFGGAHKIILLRFTHSPHSPWLSASASSTLIATSTSPSASTWRQSAAH